MHHLNWRINEDVWMRGPSANNVLPPVDEDRLTAHLRLSPFTIHTKLIKSIIKGDSAENIDLLIRGGENVNSISYDRFTPLHYAVINPNCDYDVVLALLESGANINACSFREGMTPIHMAVQNPYMKPEIIRALLTWQDANVNALGGSPYKFTPLHYAVGGQCKEEIVRLLLDLRADLTKVERSLLPIHVALLNCKCSMKVIKLLIQRGSPVSTMCPVGSPLFMLLCRPDYDWGVLRLMLRNGAHTNSDIRLSNDVELLDSLKGLRCSSFIHNLIENYNPHTLTNRGFYKHARPLIAALVQPNVSIDDFEYILKRRDCDPNFVRLDYRSVLAIAVKSAKLDLPKLGILLRYGAKFHEHEIFPGSDDLFDLLNISEKRDLTLRVLQVFIDCYDNFKNITSSSGCDLLHHSIKINTSPDCIRLLLKHCFPPDHIHLCHFSALHHAASSIIPLDVLEDLLEQSENVNVRDLNLNTPLHMAGHCPEVVKMLLRYGADATLINKYKKNPFHTYFEIHMWDPNSELLQLPFKAMILHEYFEQGFFDCDNFITNLLKELELEDKKKIEKDLKPLVQDCQSELGYACIFDPSVFYMLVSRFSLKLQLRKGLIKSKTQSNEERLLIKEKMLQTLHDRKLLIMLKSRQYPLYGDFSLLLLNKLELSVIASELKIPLKIKDLQEFKYAPPLSILILAEYLTSSDLTNLILAFI